MRKPSRSEISVSHRPTANQSAPFSLKLKKGRPHIHTPTYLQEWVGFFLCGRGRSRGGSRFPAFCHSLSVFLRKSQTHRGSPWRPARGVSDSDYGDLLTSNGSARAPWNVNAALPPGLTRFDHEDTCVWDVCERRRVLGSWESWKVNWSRTYFTWRAAVTRRCVFFGSPFYFLLRITHHNVSLYKLKKSVNSLEP